MNSNQNRPNPSPSQRPRPQGQPPQGQSSQGRPSQDRPSQGRPRPQSVPQHGQAQGQHGQAQGRPRPRPADPGQPPRPRRPLTPEQRAAREQARKRRKQQAQIRVSLTLGALILALILLVTGIAKCAIGSGKPADTGTSGITTDSPIESPEQTDDPSGTEPPESSPPASQSPTETDPPANPPETNSPATQAPITPPEVVFTLPESVQSRYILLVNRTTGKVIYEKNADATAYPASITKLMTVLCAIESLEDTDATVTITQDLIDRLRARGAARAGFFAGEKVKAKDLMYAALLPSGADGSVGLAELVAGSEEEFARLMNKKAAELGMTNTKFVNATGLHEDGHYSTCRDLYKLLDAALENELLRKVFTAESYRTEPTNIHDAGIWMRSTMFRYLEEEEIERDYFLGGKTGYTGQAGLCLASLSKYDGDEYLLITMGAGNGDNIPRYQVHDAVAILDAYFALLG